MQVKRPILLLLIVPCFLIIAGIFSSCDSSRVFDDMARIQNSEWKRQDKVAFDFSITDTNALYNVYVQIRNTTDYPFSNLYLFLLTKDARGSVSKDTIECTLAEPDGKWMGKGMGKLKESRILIKKDMQLATGAYHIEIEQAMRKDILQGISDVGLRIEKE